MSEQTTLEVLEKNLRDMIYNMFRDVGAQMNRPVLEQLRINSKELAKRIEDLAEHKAKVICGQFIKEVRETLAELKPKPKSKGRKSKV